MKENGEKNKLSTFKLFKDLLIPQWYRDYYEVQAKSLEEAIDIVKYNKELPYHSELLEVYSQEAIKIEILNEDENVLYETDL